MKANVYCRAAIGQGGKIMEGRMMGTERDPIMATFGILHDFAKYDFAECRIFGETSFAYRSESSTYFGDAYPLKELKELKKLKQFKQEESRISIETRRHD